VNFHDKIVLIAGGTGGLGRDIAMAFLTAGATVAVTYRDQAEYDALATTASRAGLAPLAGLALDVTQPAAVESAVAGLLSKFERLDVLVNAVGGYAGGKRVWEIDPSDFDRMLRLNLMAGFVLARAVAPAMVRQNRGWIVNIASKAAVDHQANSAAYAASKAAALALFDSLAAELKSYNVNVNSVLPSIMDTPANRQSMPNADFSKWPKTEDVARVVLFLCSEEARLIQGAAIPVYGQT
jgi:NAD(P)-dependent dehydrogenase (short-subunit alcohol dehydrogenase family)